MEPEEAMISEMFIAYVLHNKVEAEQVEGILDAIYRGMTEPIVTPKPFHEDSRAARAKRFVIEYGRLIPIPPKPREP